MRRAQLVFFVLLIVGCQSKSSAPQAATGKSMQPVPASHVEAALALTNGASDTPPATPTFVPVTMPSDPFLWLEEIESERALAKVNGWNARSTGELQGDARYAQIEGDVRKILLAEDRIPYGSFDGNFVYNFWQDSKSIRGLWRRTTLAEYKKPQPKWDTIIDLDELSKTENENWVWKGASCLPPKNERCMIHLSRGGKDANEQREFDVEKKAFVADGFKIAEAKSRSSWLDLDHLFIATDFGAGTMTKSGYPRQVRNWQRGQALADSKLIFEAEEGDVSATGYVSHRPDGDTAIVMRGIDSVNEQLYAVNKDGGLKKLPLPTGLIFEGIFRNRLLAVLRSDLTIGSKTIKSGRLVSWNLKNLKADPVVVYSPNERESIEGTSEGRGTVYLSLMSNVKSKLLRLMLTKTGEWKPSPLPLPEDGNLAVVSENPYTDTIMVSYSGFLTPSSVLLMENPQGQARVVRSLAARFDSSGLMSEQLETTSRDGTKIPYFVVRSKAMKYDGLNPTLLSGYGGFNISRTPFYLGAIGKVFSEKGGVYVVANIRGGGEFGPKWHEAARLKNRQKAFDDFIAVAEDLIKRGITSPAHLGIQGGSNGGLLVGAVFTQRPELFNAVLCEVPLADMLRYHKLLAGASWMGEYGNPEDPDMYPFIRAYSPYQNLTSAKKYPRVFFMTSTRDDRVHPGHARKMAARMEELGDPFLYYENTEGGHSAAANIEQRVKFSSLEWTYVWRQLAK